MFYTVLSGRFVGFNGDNWRVAGRTRINLVNIIRQ